MGKQGVFMFILRHKINGRVVKQYKLRDGLVTIGSGRKARVRLSGPGVLPLHATIERKGFDQWRMMDLSKEAGDKVLSIRMDGKKILEAFLTGPAQIQIGQHLLEFGPAPRLREVFRTELVKDPDFPIDRGLQLVLLKKAGRIVASQVIDASEPVKIGPSPESHFQLNVQPSVLSPARREDDPVWLRVGEFVVIRTPVSKVEKEKIKISFRIDPEVRKPFGFTLLAMLLFVLAFLGLPVPEEKRPESNQYTRMIYDAKILKQRRERLKESLKTASSSNFGPKTEAGPKQNTQTTKTIANLRSSGIQSIIGKIAARATSSAKLLASLSRMPAAQASVEMGKVVSIGAADGGKNFKLGQVGTRGKGGGSTQYGQGAGLGQGNVGTGNVGIDDEETAVEGGLDKEVIAAVIKEHIGQIRYCYERQLAGQADLHGKVKVRFGIDAEGEVFTQSIGETTLKSATVEECILRRIAKWKFPKPKGGTQVNVSYPFLFKSVN